MAKIIDIDWSKLPDKNEPINNTEIRNKKLVESIISAIDSLKSKLERDSVQPKSLEPQNEKVVQSTINAIDSLKATIKEDSIQSKALSENLVSGMKTMVEIGEQQIEVSRETPKIEEKRKWNMDVIRNNRGLIKSIEVEEL